MKFDAIVIGAGPAGCGAALRLAGAGWRIAVVERSEFPRRKVCGEYLSGTNWQFLRQLGVWGAFDAAAGPEIKRVALFQRTETPVTARLPHPGIDSPNWGRALTRDQLDTLLLREAAHRGATVFQPAHCRQIERCSAGWSCEIAAGDNDPQMLQAPVVIAAHGSWSRAVTPTQDATPPARGTDLLGFKAHFQRASLPNDLMPLLAFPGGYGGMVTCQQGLVSLSCCVRRDLLARLRRGTSDAAGPCVLKHIVQSIPAVRRVLADSQQPHKWLAAGPIRPGLRRRYHEGVFSVGNAAGEAHPVVAEGISMAMQSGCLAAECLLGVDQGRALQSADQINAAGQRYSSQWKSCFATRIRVSSVIAYWAMHPRFVAVTEPVLRSIPSLLTVGARLSGKSRTLNLKDVA